MNMNRRELLAAGAGVAAGLAAGGRAVAGGAAAKVGQIESIRSEFPRAVEQVYLDAAAHVPLSKYTAEGMRKYMDFHMYGPGEGRGAYAAESVRQAKALFAKLINAKPSEIAFVICTKAGEARVVNGLGIQESGGNLVTNDLHYAGSIHDYIGRRKHGMDVRIVKHRDWHIDLGDMEKAVDRKTKLVSITLVSNVNGNVENAKAISELAHAHGAYVYADIIQAVGSVPVDVKALGIDFAACSNYKWLQGIRGAGFLYVREDLQGTAVKDTIFPGYVDFNYAPWVTRPEQGQGDFPYRANRNGSRYEAGNVSDVGYAGEYEALQRILAIGVDNIYAHTRPMCERLKKELPGMGYTLITPREAASSMVVVQAKDLKAVRSKLARANIQVTTTGENRVRISPALYNNMGDIDRLLAALA
ncbi:MAG TPA: aminotransferase class V-fold PLP-dependent enzyme [Bryobacterales bacterium]|nr:aminotransferase class V-fold PLP-dependent enzyme [Bryobacterales bacterium]